jgi:hypothetical protein
MSDSKDRIKQIVEQEAYSLLNEGLLQEGIWGKMKNFAAKTLGTWEKGGKIRGRGKRSRAAEAQYVQAMQKLQNVASKESRDLIGKLEKEFKEAGYPNQEDKEQFLTQTMDIAAFYESLKKAVESKQMDVVVANEIIDQLRLITKKFLDYELADIYKHFSENTDRDQDEIILETIVSDLAMEQQDEKEAGPIGTDKKSTVVKGLKSNKLPAILAALGAATILGKFLVESDWFKTITTKFVEGDIRFDDMQTEVVGKLSPEPGEGITQMLGRVMHGDASHFAPDVDPQTMFDQMRAAGIDAGELSQLSENPAEFMKEWGTATSSGAGTLGEMFGSEPGALGLKLGKTVVIRALKPLATAVAKTVAKTTVVGKIGASLGPFLGPLGIALVSSAIGVKALRMKGLKSSRAQVLNDLLQSLDYLDDDGDREDEEEKPPVQPPVDFEIPILIRFDDDDVKYYRLNARLLQQPGARERAEDVLRSLEKSGVIGRDLQESETFQALFEQEDDAIDDTDSFERAYGRGQRVKDLRQAVSKTRRRRGLAGGFRTKPVYYYVFDRSIEDDLNAMARGAKFNQFVSRVLRKAIAAVKAKGNKALTAEEAFAAIARRGGGGTGMKGLNIKEALQLLRKYNVIEGGADVSDKSVAKATKRGPQKGGSGGSALAQFKKGAGQNISEAIRECRVKGSEDKFNTLVEKLIK